MPSAIRQYNLFLAWLIALFATLATLYSSEILSLPTCHLCWYQRIAMYPLAIILGIAAYRNDLQIKLYTIPLTLIGALFAIYQYLEQMIPAFSPIGLCGSGPDCSNIHLHLLGFITFPLLSLIAFLIIFFLLVLQQTTSN